MIYKYYPCTADYTKEMFKTGYSYFGFSATKIEELDVLQVSKDQNNNLITNFCDLAVYAYQ